jgi:hypothetical protein
MTSLAAAACLALAPALATSNHHYGKGEYAIIRHGLATGRSRWRRMAAASSATRISRSG